jgi:predicted CXXCH cytochrome family protein
MMGLIMRNGIVKNKIGIFFSIVFFIVSIILFYTEELSAKVSGPCANCHTMHNSQNGPDGPNPYLINVGADICIGCHSSDVANETIKDLGGGSLVPIVFNTAGYPTNPLAGGNFYYVSLGGTCSKGDCDEYGHNVYGISNSDSNLNEAPGNKNCSGLTSPCHKTLAVAPDPVQNWNKTGCERCHFTVDHHDTRFNNTHYRFLNGHEGPNHYVEGVEDDDWEQETAVDHNWYKGYAGPVTDAQTLADTHSISTFCGGCHYNFHRDSQIGTGSPWLRHPTDIVLPETGEYGTYDPTTDYSAEAPVAWVDPQNPIRSQAIVMCLSCHRPHGSDQPDMLRWDYSLMEVSSGRTNGCFTCHTQKN